MDAVTSPIYYGYVDSIIGWITLSVAIMLWISTGLRAVALLVRHGHDVGRRPALRMAFGPLLAGWALYAIRRGKLPLRCVEVAAGERDRVDLVVLVGVLEPPETIAAADPLLRRLADRIHEIVVLRPLGAGRDDDDRGTRTMVREAERLSDAMRLDAGPQPRIVVADGEAAAAIKRFTHERQSGLVIVVGGHRPIGGSQT
ncbi:MAG TPA: hypothetical protein VE623_00960 [Acidimicrobiales bacterium]|jgi:hypothetical protein|nr:hypothetical protein [Acidimicrobiales bacterium]